MPRLGNAVILRAHDEIFRLVIARRGFVAHGYRDELILHALRCRFRHRGRWVREIREDSIKDMFLLQLRGQQTLHVLHHENRRTVNGENAEVMAVKFVTRV